MVRPLKNHFFSHFSRISSRPIPPDLIRTDDLLIRVRSQFPIHSGGSALRLLLLPVSRCWAKKAGPGPARKKINFPGSHAVQLARVSPLLETLRLRPQTLHQRYVPKLRNYWIVTKMGGLGGRRRMPPRPSSHPALISLLECFPLLAPSRAATPLCPENGRFHSTSI